MHTTDNRKIIGRAAELTFTDFSTVPIPAKIDTGAYRSAVHASGIHVDEDGVLHFCICGGHSVCADAAFESSTSEYKVVDIENSFGDHEDRYEVKLRIKIGDEEYITPFTLANRQQKIYPILLGRIALKHRFLVDIDKTDVDRAALKAAFAINLPSDEDKDED